MYKSPESFAIGKGLELSTERTNSAPATILSLPKLSTAIPVCYAEGIEEPIMLMARYLANANMITSDDRKTDEKIADVIARVMKRVIDQHTGEMKKFHLDFHFSTNESNPYSSYSSDENAGKEIFFSIGMPGEMPYLNVQNAMLELNKVHPDLAQTIYAVLEMASIRSMGILTFSNCMGRFASELCIACDDEEKEYFESEEIPFRTKEEMEELGKKFDVPWITNAKPVLTPYEVWCMAEAKACPKWIKHCIYSALEVAQAYEQETTEMGLGMAIDTTPLWSLGVVEFFDQDPTQQLMDDICNEANQCSDNYTESLHEENIPLATEKEFLKRWDEISRGLVLLGKLDKLFHSLDHNN